MDTGNMRPLEQIAMLYANFEFSKEGGGGASVFSRAAAGLEHAATSAVNIAQRSASWLARKALKITHTWTVRLDDNDTVSMSSLIFIRLLGGLSTSLAQDNVVGQVAFSHGGLDFVFFFADPAQPLDGTLRSTWVRIASTKTPARRPFVLYCAWGYGKFESFCESLGMDTVGTKMLSAEEDVSQLLEKLKVSPGGGDLSDGNAQLCIGQSDVETKSLDDFLA
ncbi:hypothetical protein T484DRAFT_1985531 [Baffinella frigidus]|nr:hypothetical protein T484DRAFT_1985531 [Cryptophyta sp. CCMP2293]